jgi:hypothetical protein
MTYVSAQYYKHICPKYGCSYASSVSGRRIYLGPGIRCCKRCQYVFRDGSREWKTLNRRERIRYWVPLEVLVCLAFSMIFGSAFVPLIGGNALLIPPLFVLLILGPFFVIQLKRREESIERTMGRRCDKGGTAAMFNQAEQASGERWKVASADELTAAIDEAAQQYSGKNAERK